MSLDDSHLPHSQLPLSSAHSASSPSLRRVVTAASTLAGPRRMPSRQQQQPPLLTAAGKDGSDSTDESVATTPTGADEPVPEPEPVSVSVSAAHGSLDGDGSGAVTPGNLKQALSRPSISSAPTSNMPELTNTPGLRAAEAYVRPSPITVAGTIVQYGFDLRRCEFTLTVDGGAGLHVEAAGRVSRMDGVMDVPEHADKATADTVEAELLPVPTTILLPEFHFPEENTEVEVSSGKWEVAWDEEETELAQKLRWWHGPGEQTVRVTGLVRKHNYVEGVSSEDGYYDQVSSYLSSCSVM